MRASSCVIAEETTRLDTARFEVPVMSHSRGKTLIAQGRKYRDIMLSKAGGGYKKTKNSRDEG